MTIEGHTDRVSSGLNGVDDAVGVSDRKWYVAIVNNRHEKAVAEKLSRMGFETYVAKQQEIRLWNNGRKKKVDRIVIPGFVFLKCTEQERRSIVCLPYINRFLINRSSRVSGTEKPLAIISEKEIAQMKFILGQSDYKVKFDPVCNYKVADQVKVVRGALSGLIGKVLAVGDGIKTVTIMIDHLGCAKVDICLEDLQQFI